MDIYDGVYILMSALMVALIVMIHTYERWRYWPKTRTRRNSAYSCMAVFLGIAGIGLGESVFHSPVMWAVSFGIVGLGFVPAITLPFFACYGRYME